MGKATKRIPVTEERWRQLHDLKQAGESFDDVINRLVEGHDER